MKLKNNNNINKSPESQWDLNENNNNSVLKIGPKDFNIIGLLGKGSFGNVYLVQKIDNKCYYAMKALEKQKFIKNNLLKYAITEKNVMVLNNNPFIVKLYFAFQT